MSDDLVKLLRADDGDWRTDQAVDRIKELEVGLSEMRRERDRAKTEARQWKAMSDCITAEAKLAKLLGAVMDLRTVPCQDFDMQMKADKAVDDALAKIMGIQTVIKGGNPPS